MSSITCTSRRLAARTVKQDAERFEDNRFAMAYPRPSYVRKMFGFQPIATASQRAALAATRDETPIRLTDQRRQ